MPPGATPVALTVNPTLVAPGDPDLTGHAGTANLTVLAAVDATAPVITLTAPVNGAEFQLNQAVNAADSCTDNTAVASCVGTVASGQRIDTASVGNKSFTVTARDAAGNQTVVSAQYTVVFPTTRSCLWNDAHAILPPADANGSSVFTAGFTVFVRFRVCDACGQPITTGSVATDSRIVQRERPGVVQVLNSPVRTERRHPALRSSIRGDQ